MLRPIAVIVGLAGLPAVAQAVDPVALVEQCGGFRMAVALDGADLAQTERAAEVLAGRVGGERLFGLALFDAVTVAGPGEVVIHRAGRTELGLDRGVLLRGGGQLDVFLGIDWTDLAEAAPGERLFADTGMGTHLRVRAEPLIASIGVESAELGFDHNGAVAINFRFDADGARAFGQATTEHVGDILALVLDDELLTAPRVMGPILGGAGLITGSFTQAEAEALAVVMSAGVLSHEGVVLREEIVTGSAPDEAPCTSLEFQEDETLDASD